VSVKEKYSEIHKISSQDKKKKNKRIIIKLTLKVILKVKLVYLKAKRKVSKIRQGGYENSFFKNH